LADAKPEMRHAGTLNTGKLQARPSFMRRFALTVLIFLVAIAFDAAAVTSGDGPGGVGTTDGTSQLELWARADSLNLADGAAVSAWNDASGKGRNLTQGSASLRPAFVANALAGKPIVRFAADSFANLTFPSTNSEFTIVAVIQPTVTGAYHNIIDGVGGTRPMLWVDGLGNYEYNFTTGAVAPSGGGYDVLFAVKRSTGAQISQLYLNGPAVSGSGPNAFTIPASQSYTLFNRSGSQGFNGDIAEFIIYSAALTEAEIGKVGYYLQQKYALSTSFPPPFAVLVGYQEDSAIYGVNVPIPTNAPIVSGGTPTGFSVSPSLPAGLTLNPSTGFISGTPTAITAEASYTVTATFAGQPDSSRQITISVTAPALADYSRSPAVFTRARVASPVQPVLRSGSATGFSVIPALPAGLALDPVTGVISGTPTVAAASAIYTITATFAGYPSSSYDLALEVLEASTTLDITEFMAANDSTIADGDGAYSDWIEIRNYGAIPIDLAGWSLTDNASNLRKWIFPTRILAPGAYLIVFASGDSHVDPAGYLHADIKLEAGGEYLALVQPDGVTIAREFAPTFPPQVDDISYGTRDRLTYGSYTQPTPGAENGFFTASSTPITASPAGRAFSGSLNVTLTAPLGPGEVIRYTLNGTAPSAASPVYSTPLVLSANTRLRARVFAPGLNPGPEVTHVYLRLGADVQGFSSNLPVVFLSSDSAIAGSSSPTLTGSNAVIVDVDSTSGRAAAIGTPNYAGRSGLRIRGRSSQSFPQKQYKFETWDGTGAETDAPLLGLPSSSDWVLSSQWSEKTLVRNALAYRTWEKLGWPALGTKFVEVFVNDDGDGQFTYADDYAGVYMLVESIDLERVGISGPQNTSNPAGITGGYIIETGNADDQDFSTTGSGRSVAHKHRDPDVGKLNATQRTWIRDYMARFEQALYGPGFIHPTTGQHYSAYTHVASQVDYKIAREWSRNFDGGSTYSHVPRGGKLIMSPLWDYNWAFGNVNYAEGGDIPAYRTDGWNRSFTGNVNGWAPWWLRFEQDPDFWQLFADRWAELRSGVLADAAVNAEIDALTAPLAREAAARNFARWPQLGLFTAISAPGYESRTTYQSEVVYLKNWLRDRSAWIDSQFLQRPVFSRPPGQVTAGVSVTISASAGHAIYYTIDRSDPRVAGGGVNPAAQSIVSGSSITVNSSILVKARVKNGAAWSAPAIAAYVTGTPGSSQNLVISEFSYHPADPTAAELASDPTLSDDDFEFIELRNISEGAIDLTGIAFTEGVRFVFPAGLTLAPGAYVVVVENSTAFALRYGSGGSIAGQYTGNLNNSGDTIALKAADGSDIVQFHYSDSWTPAADGRGYTLTLRNPNASPSNYGIPAAWGLGGIVNGSPGAANGPVFAGDFALWQQSIFPEADLGNPQLSGPLADPDRDGASNLLEFACATQPLDPSSQPRTDTLLEPGETTFIFPRRRQALDLLFVVEETSDFLTWKPITAGFQSTPESAEIETVQVPVAQGAGPGQFLRLRVIKAD
jgi:hypothetical protein